MLPPIPAGHPHRGFDTWQAVREELDRLGVDCGILLPDHPRLFAMLQVITGIIHALKSGCRWSNCPESYGTDTTIYDRFNRWARRGIWEICSGSLPAEDAFPPRK